jgi:hypothetical protein
LAEGLRVEVRRSRVSNPCDNVGTGWKGRHRLERTAQIESSLGGSGERRLGQGWEVHSYGSEFEFIL